MINITLSWKNIKEDFTARFEKTFITNKKAHFDSVPPQLRVVDGAKLRWCSLILLDAVIYLLELREINEASRRSFNQQKVLIECIVAELERTNVDQYHQYLSRDDNAPADYEIVLDGLSCHWSDADRLQYQILSDPTTKSREKFLNIVDSLFNHPVLAAFQLNLPSILRHVVTRVLQRYPVCSVPETQQAGAVQAIQDQPGFDTSMFDDIIESELDSQPWDFLDEFMSCSPLSHMSTNSTNSNIPASVPVCERPSHPLPLEGAGYTQCGTPMVHCNHHALPEFRSIDHLAAEARSCSVGIRRPTAMSASQAPSLFVCTDYTVDSAAPCSKTQLSGPFPDPANPSVYSRRLSFATSVTPVGTPAGLFGAAVPRESPCLWKQPSIASMTSTTTSTTCPTVCHGWNGAVVSTSNSPCFPIAGVGTAVTSAAGASAAGYWECSTGDDDLDFDMDLEGLSSGCHSFDSDDLAGLFVPITAAVDGAPVSAPPASSRKRSCQVLEDSLLGPVCCKPRYAVNY